MTHELKSWPCFFELVRRGIKRFECRKDDRGFHVGDILWLREWDPNTQQYTGRNLKIPVLYILHGPFNGLAEGFVIMSLDYVYNYVGPIYVDNSK